MVEVTPFGLEPFGRLRALSRVERLRAERLVVVLMPFPSPADGW